MNGWIDQGRWNTDTIRLVVLLFEVDVVLNIQLPLQPREDILRWPFTKYEGTTARSFYHRLKERDQLVNGDNMQGRSCWSTIWTTRAWPKVKTFVWKLWSNAIVERSNLESRGLPTSPICPACDAVETREHLILGYGWTRTVWKHVVGLDAGGASQQAVADWIFKGTEPTFTSGADKARRWELCMFTCW